MGRESISMAVHGENGIVCFTLMRFMRLMRRTSAVEDVEFCFVELG
jgi:hypothetical protein